MRFPVIDILYRIKSVNDTLCVSYELFTLNGKAYAVGTRIAFALCSFCSPLFDISEMYNRLFKYMIPQIEIKVKHKSFTSIADGIFMPCCPEFSGNYKIIQKNGRFRACHLFYL